MHNGRYISIQSMLSRLLRNPLLSDLNESDVASYIADGIRFIEAPLGYEEKVAVITITDHRGELPCDIVYIQQTQKYKVALNELAFPTTNINYGYIPMKYATDHFHTSLHADTSPDLQKNGFTGLDYENTYKIQGNYIFTSFHEGTIRMSYKGLLLDKEGFPMIPDDIKVIKAIENHIKSEAYTILWELGKIQDKVYREVQKERDWYMGAANTSMQMQSLDQAENMKAMLTRTILKPLQHSTGFKNLGTQEYVKNI